MDTSPRKRARLEPCVSPPSRPAPHLAPAGLAAVLPLVGPAARHIPEVRVSVSREPPTGSVPAEGEWQPEFTHQCFPLPLSAHGDPLLRVWYRDPDLAWCGVLSCTSAGPEEDVRGMLDVVTPEGASPAVLVRDIGDTRWPDLRGPASALPPPPPSPWQPPGLRVASYGAAGKSFVVHRWALDSRALRDYHDRMATLAPWLIETASRINTADPRWSVLGVYAEEREGAAAQDAPPLPYRYALVGYATVYTFTNPMRKERPDVLRLAQLVVLPPYQRQGHGGRLLDAVCALADEADVLEVTVESPCEGMARLRDAHDTRRALVLARAGTLPALAFVSRLGAEQAGLSALTPATPPPSPPIADLSAEGVAALQRALRITVAQAHRVHEALLLASCVDTADEASLRTFRLLVKRRVFAGDADIRALPDPEERKRALEEAFQDGWAQAALAAVAAGAAVSAAALGAASAASVERYLLRVKEGRA